ncbi:rhodanese-like domain-containing protein [Desulfogranum japonicum]|uniref:rhodanese-like domain-containing protein n=1 Tax=Desulfogranum japonicum TaxID=231447 RepID=UPI00040D623E|nr:rhodanese-like domain-containing protein [Desulfogranum japonicum]
MESEFINLSVQQTRKFIKEHLEQEYLLIDVRQPHEYTKGHIPGALLLPLSELSARMGELAADRDLLFYCRSGHRSQAAAIFAANQAGAEGRKVYNMEGGILAWDGVTATNVPNLNAFDMIGPPSQLLFQAMEMERGAERLYQELMKRFQQPILQQLLDVLVRAEEGHARAVYRYWAEQEDSPAPFELVYRQLKGDILEGGIEVSHALDSVEKQAESPCRVVFELALAVEFAAYDLYRSLAHYFAGQKLEKTFLAIAQAEKEHMRIVAEAIGSCDN